MIYTVLEDSNGIFASGAEFTGTDVACTLRYGGFDGCKLERSDGKVFFVESGKLVSDCEVLRVGGNGGESRLVSDKPTKKILETIEYARTAGRFTSKDIARQFGLGIAAAQYRVKEMRDRGFVMKVGKSHYCFCKFDKH